MIQNLNFDVLRHSNSLIAIGTLWGADGFSYFSLFTRVSIVKSDCAIYRQCELQRSHNSANKHSKAYQVLKNRTPTSAGLPKYVEVVTKLSTPVAA